MITIPTDPIEAMKSRLHRLALTLMDEEVIISVGMNKPNEIVTTPIYFEKLESEPSPRRRVAQQYRRSRERIQQRLEEQMTMLCISLFVLKQV